MNALVTGGAGFVGSIWRSRRDRRYEISLSPARKPRNI